mmetsp:Transcript_10450/g.20017  ORF Transcript_10450/g.20017 Transcript_10450/m.20017 type:complete len:82 (+) Transcript_10450:448-693(+)
MECRRCRVWACAELFCLEQRSKLNEHTTSLLCIWHGSVPLVVAVSCMQHAQLLSVADDDEIVSRQLREVKDAEVNPTNEGI